MSKHVAIYPRVSSKRQDHRSQLPDLERWAEGQDDPVRWYRETFNGKGMDRPAWNQLEADMRSGKVSTIVVWRLDRLGRTASGLTTLFDELQRRRINLVSLKDGIDLNTAAGRLMANVIASVSQYDNELRSERVIAGQSAARKAGKRWGGSKAGVRKKIKPQTERAIRKLRAEGMPISDISRTLKLSRPSIYSVLKS